MSPSAVKCYQDLTVWQKSMTLTTHVYKLTEAFLKSEQFGLTSQMRRAAVSIPSNIAEGQSRNSTGEFRQFLGISKGSLAELETQIEVALRLTYLQEAQVIEVRSLCVEISKMLAGLSRSLANH